MQIDRHGYWHFTNIKRLRKIIQGKVHAKKNSYHFYLHEVQVRFSLTKRERRSHYKGINFGSSRKVVENSIELRVANQEDINNHHPTEATK